jgi:hypothetical protein
MEKGGRNYCFPFRVFLGDSVKIEPIFFLKKFCLENMELLFVKNAS